MSGKKIATIAVLIFFLAFTALSAVMYLAGPKEDNSVEIIAQCETAGGIRDEEVQECFENPEDMVSAEEECNEIGGTRYAENEVCVN